MSPKTDEEREAMKRVPYREAVGSLLFSATTTRPDIAFAVNQVAQYSSDPGPAHWTAVKRIMRFLQQTKADGLLLGSTADQLVCYCDSDYAVNLDTRRSTSGYIVCRHAVRWSDQLGIAAAEGSRPLLL